MPILPVQVPAAVGGCARHPSEAGVGACRRCGDYLCSACVAFDSGSGYFCGPCSKREDASVRRGRRIVIAVVVATLLNMAFLVGYQAHLGTLRIGHVGRAIIYAWVCWNMYRGRGWARRVFLILMVVAAIGSGIASSRDAVDHVADIVMFVGLAALIAFPNSVRAFFAAPRPFSESVRG